MPSRARRTFLVATAAVATLIITGCSSGTATSETSALTAPTLTASVPARASSAPTPAPAQGGEQGEGGENGEGGEQGEGGGPQVTPPPSAGTTTTYTLDGIAQHATTADCWTTIGGGVFDVTQWIPLHPGGPQVVAALCGSDGSAAYNTRHGRQNEPAQVLAYFQVGVLSS